MELLARIAAVPGDRSAAETEAGPLAFGPMRSAAAALARLPSAAGLQAGDRVAMLLEGLPAAVAMIGTWAAGCVCVPLEAHLPRQRIQELLEQSGAGLLLAAGPRGRSLARALGGTWPARTVLLDAPSGWTGARVDLRAAGEAGDPLPLDRAPRGDAAASILFTSGSTGRPKGVVVTAAHVDAFALHWAGELGLGPGDRVVQTASPAFDLSLFEVGSTWSAGAALLPAPAGLKAFPERLGAWLARVRPTCWYAVPSLLAPALLASGLSAEAAPRLLLYAGERMPGPVAAELLRRYPASALWNLFGPTETNVSCAHRLPPRHDGGEVPIGRPCPYIELAVAEDGELLACGPTVTPGYWGEPDRAPWVEVEGRRMLRTGDRVRRDADGLLRFLGRKDRMLKVRGYRVEPEEVEALLLEAGAREAGVVLLDGGDGVLAAGVVGGEPARLEAAMAARLPPWACAELHPLDALPRTPRGKTDLAALAARLREARGSAR